MSRRQNNTTGNLQRCIDRCTSESECTGKLGRCFSFLSASVTNAKTKSNWENQRVYFVLLIIFHFQGKSAKEPKAGSVAESWRDVAYRLVFHTLISIILIESSSTWWIMALPTGGWLLPFYMNLALKKIPPQMTTVPSDEDIALVEVYSSQTCLDSCQIDKKKKKQLTNTVMMSEIPVKNGR